jgi:undecaprenyl-diphosphatase
LISTIIQGIIQGLTEFLPVSSSGHLTLYQFFTGLKDHQANLTMDLAVHLGTLLAVFFYFRNDLIPYFTIKGWKDAKLRKIAFLVIAGSIPTAIMGIGLKKHFKVLFTMPKAVCAALFITGLLLLVSEKLKKNQKSIELQELSYLKAFFIGIAQGFAITPGISRSGSTISAGLISKLSGEDSAKFSFLLMIPAVGGATLLEAKDILEIGLSKSLSWTQLGIGCVTAAVTGFLALQFLVYIIKKQKLNLFAYYLFAASIISFILISFPGTK